jgi:hypothetical protein
MLYRDRGEAAGSDATEKMCVRLGSDEFFRRVQLTHNNDMNQEPRPREIPGGLLALLMVWVLVLDGSLQPAPQPQPKTVHAEPPRILYIYREYWKPGTQAALNRIETKGARMCIDLKCPHPYLGIESLTGSKEVWYLNGFTSTEEQKCVAEEYNKKGLFAAMNQFTQQRAPFQSGPGKDGFSNYHPELSRGVPWSMGQGRFLVIVVTKGNPQSDGTVFETEEGLRFIVTPAQTRAEANARLSSAGPGAKIFAVRPHFSMPAPEWVAADPLFWSSSPSKR